MSSSFSDIIRNKYITDDLLHDYDSYISALEHDVGETGGWPSYALACIAISNELEAVEPGGDLEAFYVSRMNDLVERLSEINSKSAIEIAANRFVNPQATNSERQEMFNSFISMIDKKIDTQMQTSPKAITKILEQTLVSYKVECESDVNEDYVGAIQHRVEQVSGFKPEADPFFSDEVVQKATDTLSKYDQQETRDNPVGHAKHLAIRALYEHGENDAALYLCHKIYTYDEAYASTDERDEFHNIALTLYSEKFSEMLDKAHTSYMKGEYLQAASYAGNAQELVNGRYVGYTDAENKMKALGFSGERSIYWGETFEQSEKMSADRAFETFKKACIYKAGAVDHAISAYDRKDYDEAADYVWSKPYNADVLYNQHLTRDNEQNIYQPFIDEAVAQYANENDQDVSTVQYKLQSIRLYADLKVILDHIEQSFENKESMPMSIRKNVSDLEVTLERYGLKSFDEIPAHVISALDGDVSGRFNNAMIKSQIFSDILCADSESKGQVIENGQRYDLSTVEQDSFVTSDLRRLGGFVKNLGVDSLFDAAKSFRCYGISREYGTTNTYDFRFSDRAIAQTFAAYASNMQELSPETAPDALLRSEDDVQTSSEVLSDYMSAIARGACPSTLGQKADCAVYYANQAIKNTHNYFAS